MKKSNVAVAHYFKSFFQIIFFDPTVNMKISVWQNMSDFYNFIELKHTTEP